MSVQIQRDELGVQDWADKHNVHHELLPLSHREINPLHVMRNLYICFESWPKTKQTYVISETPLEPNEIRSAGKGFVPIPIWLHSYQIEKDYKSRYVNPRYVHSVNLGVYFTRPRGEFIERLVLLGNYSQRDIARMFNVHHETIQRWCDNNNLPWGRLRERGKLRLARSVECAVQWSNVTYKELSAFLDIPYTTLWEWRKKITKPLPKKPIFKV